MAEYRTVHTKIWREDEWFQTIDAEAKLLFIYLFTNSSASVAGIYRLPVRTMSFETGLSQQRISALLADFAKAGKVYFENGIVWVRRMREYQSTGTLSPKVRTRMDKDVESIPHCALKTQYLRAYGYPIDTVSIPSQESKSDTDTDTDTDIPKGAAPAASLDPLSAYIAYVNMENDPKTNRPPNRGAAAARLYEIRLGEDVCKKFPPKIGRLGGMAKKISGEWVALGEMIWEMSVPEGDPHDYLDGCIRGSPAAKRSGKSAVPFAAEVY